MTAPAGRSTLRRRVGRAFVVALVLLALCFTVAVTALAEVRAGARVLVGGIVTHRQRPATAGGVTFINLEDETGMLNVTCSPGLFRRSGAVARSSSALLVRGVLERADGVLNLVADRLVPLSVAVHTSSRDYR